MSTSKCKNCDDINKLLSDISTAKQQVNDMTNFISKFYDSNSKTITTSQVNFNTGGEPVVLYVSKDPNQTNPQFTVTSPHHYIIHYMDGSCNRSWA